MTEYGRLMIMKNGLKTVRVAGLAMDIECDGDTAKASATHDVMVSGTVTSSFRVLFLKHIFVYLRFCVNREIRYLLIRSNHNQVSGKCVRTRDGLTKLSLLLSSTELVLSRVLATAMLSKTARYTCSIRLVYNM